MYVKCTICVYEVMARLHVLSLWCVSVGVISYISVYDLCVDYDFTACVANGLLKFISL